MWARLTGPINDPANPECTRLTHQRGTRRPLGANANTDPALLGAVLSSNARKIRTRQALSPSSSAPNMWMEPRRPFATSVPSSCTCADMQRPFSLNESPDARTARFHQAEKAHPWLGRVHEDAFLHQHRRHNVGYPIARRLNVAVFTVHGEVPPAQPLGHGDGRAGAANRVEDKVTRVRVDAITRCSGLSGFCVACAISPLWLSRSPPEQIGKCQSERICRSSFPPFTPPIVERITRLLLRFLYPEQGLVRVAEQHALHLRHRVALDLVVFGIREFPESLGGEVEVLARVFPVKP